MVTSHREQLARLRLNTELVANKFTSLYALIMLQLTLTWFSVL